MSITKIYNFCYVQKKIILKNVIGPRKSNFELNNDDLCFVLYICTTIGAVPFTIFFFIL